MNKAQQTLLALLAVLGIGSGGIAVGTQLAPATAPATVNSVCPAKGWRQSAGSDPKLQPFDTRGNGISQFIVCERDSDGAQISIYTNGTVSGTNADGSRIADPASVLNGAR